MTQTHTEAPTKRKRVKRTLVNTSYFVDALGVHHLTVGVRTKNESNQLAPNWRVISGNRKAQRTKVMNALAPYTPPMAVREVTFIRWAPSTGLDDDGLRSALKSVRDQALCWLQGENHLQAKAKDGPTCGLVLKYEQHRNAAYGVSVRFA